MKYKILNKEFKNKTEITNYCRKILVDNLHKNLNKDDYDFMLTLFSYHPDENKIDGIINIFCDVDKIYNNNYFLMEKETKSGKIVYEDISFVKCINNIPFGESKPIDYIFKFGKYKGQSIYDINDNNYLEWLVKQKINRKEKIYFNQFLKYGYIPYNPVMEKTIINN